MLAALLLAAHLRELQVPPRVLARHQPPVASQATSTGPIHLTFDIPAQDVTADAVTPGGTTYWLAESRVTPSKIILPHHIIEDTDADGSVTWHLTQAYTSNALFAVVDSAGRVGIASPQWTLDNRERLSVNGSELTVSQSFDLIEAMWVRPGAGAWFLYAVENGVHDTDPAYGVMRVATSAFEPYDTGDPAPPATFENGDIIVAFYPFEGPALQTYSLLQVGAAPAAQAAIPTLSTNLLIAFGILLALIGMMRIAR